MKPEQAGSHFSNVLLTASVLLAQMDFQGLFDYGLKASMGGAIWLGYKLLADFIDKRKKQNEQNGHNG